MASKTRKKVSLEELGTAMGVDTSSVENKGGDDVSSHPKKAAVKSEKEVENKVAPVTDFPDYQEDVVEEESILSDSPTIDTNAEGNGNIADTSMGESATTSEVEAFPNTFGVSAVYELAGDNEDNPISGTEEAALISDISQYDPSHISRNTLMTMDVTSLREIKFLLKQEWGGSPAFMVELKYAKELFARGAESEASKVRKSLLDRKYAEYHRLAQSIASAMGNDVVINGLQHTAYHQMLHHLVEHYSALSDGVKEMANMLQLQYDLSEESVEDSPSPSPSNTVELLRVLLLVGTAAKSWMATMQSSGKQIESLQEGVRLLEMKVKQQSTELESERSRFAAKEKELQELTHDGYGSRTMLVNEEGKFLYKTGTGGEVNPRKLDFTSDMNKALKLPADKSRKLQDALRRWYRSEKYGRFMEKRGMVPGKLSVVRINLVKVGG